MCEMCQGEWQTYAVLKHDVIFACFGDDSSAREAFSASILSACDALGQLIQRVAQIHVIEPSIEVTNDVRVIELSQSSQFAQQIVNLGLTSD